MKNWTMKTVLCRRVAMKGLEPLSLATMIVIAPRTGRARVEKTNLLIAAVRVEDNKTALGVMSDVLAS